MVKMKIAPQVALALGLTVLGLGGLTAGMPTPTTEKQAITGLAPGALAKEARSLQPDQEKPEMSGEERLAFAVEKMKRNLDRFQEFVCRYTITIDCSAATMEDAILDRNVERGKVSWHVLWIVKKPAERFVVVNKKELLEQPVSRLIATPGKSGPIGPDGTSEAYLNVWANYLWDGTFQFRVGGGLPVSSLNRGYRGGVHPRSPGTPLEGEEFYYTEPDRFLKNTKEWQASFAGISAEGHWQIHLGPANKRPNFKTDLDPKHGFLPVHVSAWSEISTPEGRVEGYSDWYATHFQNVGQDKWITTRSISDGTRSVVWKQGQKRSIYFREFKVEHFDCEKKVAEEDLAITIPRGHQIQMGGSNWALIVDNKDRLVDYKQLPQMWKELEASAEYWKGKKK